MSDLTVNGVSYRQQYRKCGKAECRCAEGDDTDLHGPYWYAIGVPRGIQYIGKNLPEAITNHLQMLKDEKAQLVEIREKIRERRREFEAALNQAREEERAIDALMNGRETDPRVLQYLGLERFSVNGHGPK